jgi:hypothetical protein
MSNAVNLITHQIEIPVAKMHAGHLSNEMSQDFATASVTNPR